MEQTKTKKTFFQRVKEAFRNEFVGTWKGISKEKVDFPILLLVVVNVVCLLISNIIAVKTIIFGRVNGIQFSIPAAVVVYSFAIIISDILCQIDPSNKWTRRSCHIGFILNLFMVMVFEISIAIPGEVSGFEEGLGVLGSTWFMLIASITSFYMGDLLNDTIFRRLKQKDQEKNSNRKLFKRCVLSTVFGQLVDATIFITLGLQILPGLIMGFTFTGGSSLSDPIGWANTGVMILMQVCVKILCEIVVSPIVIWICNKYEKNYLG